MGFQVTFKGLGHIQQDRNPEMGRNSFFLANSSKGVFPLHRGSGFRRVLQFPPLLTTG